MHVTNKIDTQLNIFVSNKQLRMRCRRCMLRHCNSLISQPRLRAFCVHDTGCIMFVYVAGLPPYTNCSANALLSRAMEAVHLHVPRMSLRNMLEMPFSCAS